MKSDSLLKKAGPYGYILPALLVFAVFLFYPFFKTIYLSLYYNNSDYLKKAQKYGQITG